MGLTKSLDLACTNRRQPHHPLHAQKTRSPRVDKLKFSERELNGEVAVLSAMCDKLIEWYHEVSFNDDQFMVDGHTSSPRDAQASTSPVVVVWAPVRLHSTW